MSSETDLSNLLLPMPTLPDDYNALAQKAERDVLGLLMLWGDVNAVSEIEPGWFTSSQNLSIYFAIAATADRHSLTDVVTVSETLDMACQLEEVGGLHYLGQLCKESPRLRTWQLAPLLRGFALMRYAMAPMDGDKIIVRLLDALTYGWTHGKAWLTSYEQLQAKGTDYLFDFVGGEYEWVCYGYLNHDELNKRDQTLKR